MDATPCLICNRPTPTMGQDDARFELVCSLVCYYEKERRDEAAAKLNPCRFRSSITGAQCLLPDGHAPYSPMRFHRFVPYIAGPAGAENRR